MARWLFWTDGLFPLQYLSRCAKFHLVGQFVWVVLCCSYDGKGQGRSVNCPMISALCPCRRCALLRCRPIKTICFSHVHTAQARLPCFDPSHQQTHAGRVNEVAFGPVAPGVVSQESSLLASIGDDGVVAVRRLGEDSYLFR